MAGIDALVNSRADMFANNPQGLAQRYAQSQDLLDLLALQKMKQEKEAAMRNLQMQMQAPAATVKDQLEGQVLDMTKREVAQQVAPGLAMQGQRMAQAAPRQQARPTPSGVATLPAPNLSPQMMAGGGIVAFADGGMPEKPAESQMDIDIRMYQAAQRVANDPNASPEARRRAQMDMERIKAQGDPAKLFQEMDRRRGDYPGLARGGIVGYAEGDLVEEDVEFYLDSKGRALTPDDIKVMLEAGEITPGTIVRDPQNNNAPVPASRFISRRAPAPKVSQGTRVSTPTPRDPQQYEAQDVQDLLASMLTAGPDMDASVSGPQPAPPTPSRRSGYDIRQAEKDAGREAVRNATREFQGPTQDMLLEESEAPRRSGYDIRQAERAAVRDKNPEVWDALNQRGQAIQDYIKENPYDALSYALMAVPVGGLGLSAAAKGLGGLAKSNRLRKLLAPLFTRPGVRGAAEMGVGPGRVFDPMRTMLTAGTGMQLAGGMFGGEGEPEAESGVPSLVSPEGAATTSSTGERPFVGPTQDMLGTQALAQEAPRSSEGYRPGDPFAPESPEFQAGLAALASRDQDQGTPKSKRDIDWGLLAAGLSNMAGRPKGRVAGSFTKGVMGEEQRREAAQMERDKMAQASEQAGLERQNRLDIAKMQVDAGLKEVEARLDSAMYTGAAEAKAALTPTAIMQDYPDLVEAYAEQWKASNKGPGFLRGLFTDQDEQYEQQAMQEGLRMAMKDVEAKIDSYFARGSSGGSAGGFSGFSATRLQ